MISNTDATEFKDFSLELARESGKIIRSYFKRGVDVIEKKDHSPVTIADREAEQLMRKMIGSLYPEHGIVGEEFGVINPSAEYKWVLDPIDGTKSFICGAHSFGSLIALTKNNKPILGIIHQPIVNELYYGDNYSAELNGNAIKVRNTTDISEAVLLSTDHLNMHKYQNGEKFEKLVRKVKLYRLWGDCYGYALLSSGFADIMIDPIMHVWDFMALLPIVKGAGGVITDYFGKDPLKSDSTLAASTPELHKQVLNILHK